MGHRERPLLRGERIVHRAGPHAVVYLRPALLAAAAIAGSVILARRMPAWVGLAAAAVVLLVLLPEFLHHLSLEYGVTNKRVYTKVGWLGRRTAETTLNKISFVVADQSLWGRLFGYGNVVVTIAGGGKEVLYRIPAPWEFRKNLFEQILSIQAESSESSPSARFDGAVFESQSRKPLKQECSLGRGPREQTLAV